VLSYKIMRCWAPVELSWQAA